MTAGIDAADAAIYTGICLENNDPLIQGRIKYCVPQLSGTAAFGWAQPVYPGFTEIGETVNIAFEGGDRNRPLFWPHKQPKTSYPTYEAMIAANPAGWPAGSTFYIEDHGGNVQLQNDGTTWQWLPNGLVGNDSGGAPVTAYVAGGFILNQVNWISPSSRRIIKVTADVGFYVDQGPVTVGIGLVFDTVPPTPYVPVGDWYTGGVTSKYMATSDSTGVIHDWLNMANIVAFLDPGPWYVASYLIYMNPDNTPYIYTYPPGGAIRNLLVEDVGSF